MTDLYLRIKSNLCPIQTQYKTTEFYLVYINGDSLLAMSDSLFQESSQDGKIFIISFPQSLKEEHEALLDKAIKSWYLRTESLFVFNLKQCLDLEIECCRQLLIFIKKIKSQEKKLISVNVSNGVTKKLRENGLDSAFNINNDIQLGS